MKKISAAILDFAAPLTDRLSADTPVEVRRETLRLAITIWNALVLQACGQDEYLTELFDRLRKLPLGDSAAMAPLVQKLVVLRRERHEDDLRLVGEWELRDLGGGELSLRAVAHLAPAKKLIAGWDGRGLTTPRSDATAMSIASK